MKKIAIITAALVATIAMPAAAQTAEHDHHQKINSVVTAAIKSGAKMEKEKLEAVKNKILSHINASKDAPLATPASTMLDGAAKLRDRFQPKCCVKCPVTLKNGKIPVPSLDKFKCADEKDRSNRFPRVGGILNKI